MIFGKKFLEDYAVEEVEKNGKRKKRAVYIGVVHAFDNAAYAARIKAYLCVAACFLLALFVIAAVFTSSDYAVYALIPFVLEIAPIALFAMAAAEFAACGGSIKLSDKKRTLDRIAPLAIAQAVLAAASAVADIFFVALDPAFSNATGECVFICFNFLSAAVAMCGMFAARSVETHETENTEKTRMEREFAQKQAREKALEAERLEKQRELSRQINESNAHGKKKQ